MRLYIIRHAKAAPAQSDCSPHPGGAEAAADFDRELTDRGQAQARFLAARFGREKIGVRTIVASRFPRALQTAHFLQRPLACDLRTDTRLEVDHPVSEALAVIKDHADERSLMLVGHNPQLGELISVLCSGLPPQELILKTGEMVVMDIRPAQPVGSGKLVDRARLSESAADETIGSVETITSRR